MDKRRETLAELHTYIEGVDKEITMILQSLQWDRKHLLEGSALVACKYDANHRVPPDRKASHEEECFLRSQRYASDDIFLPEPLDDNAPTIVKLSQEDIKQIINLAAEGDPSFVRGPGCDESAPLTAERLQASYSADERRALYDAVVAAAPDEDCTDDLALPGTSDGDRPRPKSKLEVLAELRNMRRRRAKYRGAGAHAASSNYSHTLRDVIRTQMELFTGVKEEPDDAAYKIIENTQEIIEHKHKPETKDNGREDRRGKHRSGHNTERNDSRGKQRDYDGHTEKHRSREGKEKVRYREKYDNENDFKDISKYNKKERDYDKYDEENGHASYKSRKEDRETKDTDKYTSRRYNKDDSDISSERSYRSEKRYDSSSSKSRKKYREDYKGRYDESRSTKRYWGHHDGSEHSKHPDTKRKEEYSYDKKLKRHS